MARMLLTMIPLAVLAVASAASAETLAEFDFAADAVVEAEGGATAAKPRITAPGVTVSNLAPGAALTGRVQEGPKVALSQSAGNSAPSLFVRSRATPPAIDQAAAQQVYLAFTLTPEAGKTLRLDGLAFDWCLANGPADEVRRTGKVSVRWSLDGFAADLHPQPWSASVVGKGQTEWSAASVALPADRTLEAGQTVEFRIFFADDTSSSLVHRLDNLKVTGTVVN